MVGGDFNEILYEKEKEGGPPRNQAQMRAFRNGIIDCNLEDLQENFRGWTWNNKRDGGEDEMKQALLDGFMVKNA